jgi:hypothetical protein
VEEDFVRNLFAGGETQLGRAFVNEPALAGDNTLRVLDYERASEVIRTASHHGHRRLLLPPQDGAPGQGLRRAHGHLHDLQRHRPRSSSTASPAPVDAQEGMDLLDQAMEHNLVQFGENVREQVSLHLQLLRLLLRGDAGRQALRRAQSHRHHQLPARGQH